MPTTTMPPSFAPLAALARKQKSIAARNPHTNGEVLHLIDFMRRGRPIVRAGFPDPGPLLAAMEVGIPMVAADAVVIVADTYTTAGTGTKGLVNPITGKDWRLGDMDEIAKQDMAIERGLLGEALSLMLFARDGSWEAGTLNYTYDPKRQRLRWTEATYWDGGESDARAEELDVQARFPAKARAAFAKKLAIDICGRATSDAAQDLVRRMQHRLDVDFARWVDNEGLLLEGPL